QNNLITLKETAATTELDIKLAKMQAALALLTATNVLTDVEQTAATAYAGQITTFRNQVAALETTWAGIPTKVQAALTALYGNNYNNGTVTGGYYGSLADVNIQITAKQTELAGPPAPAAARAATLQQEIAVLQKEVTRLNAAIAIKEAELAELNKWAADKSAMETDLEAKIAALQTKIDALYTAAQSRG
ncbi:MAG: hypothetical protein LBV26_08450, partial [Bacteroidales bacterium]|nr:hypothetical protein [Bacteroidales bacterium]